MPLHVTAKAQTHTSLSYTAKLSKRLFPLLQDLLQQSRACCSVLLVTLSYWAFSSPRSATLSSSNYKLLWTMSSEDPGLLPFLLQDPQLALHLQEARRLQIIRLPEGVIVVVSRSCSSSLSFRVTSQESFCFRALLAWSCSP